MTAGRRPITTPERQDLQRSLAGDRGAFERLVAPYHPMARGLAARMLGNVDDAEDVVQEALIRAYRHLERFAEGPERPFRPWFLNVVVHLCIDALRRRDARRRHEAEWRPAEPDRPEVLSAQRDTLARVRAVIEELPPKQRAALHLRVFDELSYAEIGEALGLTSGSARVYVVRARAHLRDRLASELER